MRHASLAALLALAALAHPSPADACSPPPDGWFMNGFLPEQGTPVPADGAIVLRGTLESPIDFDEVIAALAVSVTDAAGEPVAGRLVRDPASDDLLWWPDAPLEPGAAYDLVVQTAEDSRVADLRRNEYAFVAGEALGAPPRPRVTVGATSVVEDAVHGRCVEIIDTCGGCSREVLRMAPMWHVEAELEVPPSPYAGAQSVRSALGVDEVEARAILARTPPGQLGSFGTRSLVLGGGEVAHWPSETACLAVQVLDPVAGEVLDAVECFAAPDESSPVLRLPTVDEEPPGRDLDGGCDASGGGGAHGWWALALLLGLRRRRLGLLGLVAAFGLAGCDDEAPVDPLPPSCLDCPAPEGLPPLAYGEEIPPPVFGGALAATATRAVVGDPDRDAIHVVDLSGRRVLASHVGGQPGRVAIDAARGRAYVTLRADGDVLALDLEAGAELSRRPVCAAPRGVAVDGPRLHVACAGGHLVTLDAESGAVERRMPVAPDLRDVIVTGDTVHVSRFRQPELISIRDGAIVARRAPAVRDALDHRDPSAPTVAWRSVGLPSGGVAMLHQRARLSAVRVTTGEGYGSGGDFGGGTCGESIVSPEVTVFPALDAEDTTPRSMGLATTAVLAVDLAVLQDGVALAAAGNGGEHRRWTHARFDAAPDDPATWTPCLRPTRARSAEERRQVTAVAARGEDFLAFRRDTPELLDADGDRVVALPGAPIVDAGHALFHEDAGQRIACASCHPEGSEDGHAWLFAGQGLRRTQELRGGLADTAPFHWTGELTDLQHLMDEVMTRRMGGPDIPPDYTRVLMRWIDAQPVEVVDPIDGGDPIAGELIFTDATVGCDACHSGPRLSDDLHYDVGTGGVYVTPTLLGVGRRGSLMHDGCGATLADRFDPTCGGGEAHGRTAHLSAAELRDLIAWLATL